MKRIHRKLIAFWVPWVIMTVVVVATYVEAYRLIRMRSADRFTGAQGRALEQRIKILETRVESMKE